MKRFAFLRSWEALLVVLPTRSSSPFLRSYSQKGMPATRADRCQASGLPICISLI